MKKYSMKLDEQTGLYRITALVSFADVSVGAVGGLIQSEKNLSQDGNAWVFGNARVFGNAHVYGDARVYGDAWVSDNARVSKIWHVFNIVVLRFNITVTRENIQIGCLNYSHKKWLQCYRRLAKKNRISGKQLKYIKKCAY